jgi:hypothetical protein
MSASCRNSARVSRAPTGSRELDFFVAWASSGPIASTSSSGCSAARTTSAVISFVIEAIGTGTCSWRAASTDESDSSRT